MVSKPLDFLPGIVIACLLLLPVGVCADSLPREDGPVGFGTENTPEKPEWHEQAVELPGWPQQDRLIELPFDTGVTSFRTFIDPQSVTVGDDHVVRFTSVLVSRSGVWNVTYEGLHCGARSYRRLAYGVRGKWHALPDSGWQRLTASGTGRYRHDLYYHYMCNPAALQRDARQIVQALRYQKRDVLE